MRLVRPPFVASCSRAALTALALAGVVLPALGTSAQPVTSRPVVQPLPPQDTQRLNRALVELAKEPKSVPKLLEAGNAALAVNDLDAALGFFRRLTEIEPENEPATLGLARVYLRSGRPVRALLYFDAAQSRGAGPLAIGSDQALTYDMLGDQATAQFEYSRVIKASPKDDEARRRLAISYAISGNRSGFEATLRPLIDRRDFAAFRARTFGLAIVGEQDRAAAIADAVMPRNLAQRITPYLKFMPRLTRAQQAAAANLGVFPKAADIGRDAPGVVAYMRRFPDPQPSQPELASAAPTGVDERLAPTGTPLDQAENPPSSGPSQTDAQAEPARVADAFDDRGQPQADSSLSGPDKDAVDIAAIDVPREAPPEPEPPKNPSRFWVQLATGRDLEALGFDWRRIRRKAPDLLRPYTAHTVPWGQANRLLAGPLESRQQARQLINALNRKGLDSFGYTSPEGAEIQELKVP
ncbi:MAG: tetratricopeptide repeat protein [Erythrobacter sp.]|nr:tetratricopeptide repeat protein [Erythrobacter sp.]